MWHRIRDLGLTVFSLALLLAASLTLAGPAMAQPRVIDIRIGNHGQATRLVLEMTESLNPEVSVVSAPDRVIIDLPEVAWALPMNAATASGGVIEHFRFGNFSAGRSRMVLDVRSPVVVQSSFLIEPRDGKRYRFVVDLERKVTPPARPAQSAKSSPPPSAPFQAPAPEPPTPPQVAAVRPIPMPTPTPRAKPRGDNRHVVAIDAGHGGIDPGTIGKAGTYEKNITLAMARELKKRMEATGRFRAVLTRDSDIFIPLRDRVAIARANGAEMFISLHADSSPNSKTHGGSIYTLSEVASDKEAELLAAKENKADLIAGMDLSHESAEVTSILLDLAQRETMNYSATLAAMMVRELGKSVQLLGKSHRFAGFAVLKAPDVPSVLYELGYLSNSAEEKLLKQADYRRKLADGVTRAVDQFFRERTHLGR
jgi:N-acetylmuramoyl-L-alanine amidase